MKLSGAQAIIKVLLEQGVDTVFGYPGGQVIPLYNALYDAPLRNVLTAHDREPSMLLTVMHVPAAERGFV